MKHLLTKENLDNFFNWRKLHPTEHKLIEDVMIRLVETHELIDQERIVSNVPENNTKEYNAYLTIEEYISLLDELSASIEADGGFEMILLAKCLAQHNLLFLQIIAKKLKIIEV